MKKLSFAVLFFVTVCTAYAQERSSQKNMGWVSVGPSVFAAVSDEGPDNPLWGGGFEIGAQLAKYAAMSFKADMVTGNSANIDYFVGLFQLSVLLQKAITVSESGIRPYIGVGVGAAYGEAEMDLYIPSYYFGPVKTQLKFTEAAFAANAQAGVKFHYKRFLTDLNLRYVYLNPDVDGLGNVNLSGVTAAVTIGYVF